MAEPKTKANSASVAEYLNKIVDAGVRKDCRAIATMMEKATKDKPKMWGSAIVGFSTAPVTYADGRTADWPLIAFSARKQNIVLYGVAGPKADAKLMAQLGKHEVGKGCLYLKRLADVDVATLEKLVKAAVGRKRTS